MYDKDEKVIDTYSASKRIGVLTGEKCEPNRWEVNFGGNKEFIEDVYLKKYDDTDNDSLIKNGLYGNIEDVRSIIFNRYISGELTNVFYSMHSSTTQFMLHQYKSVIKFLESDGGRLLIADEVGLGKTIESMYIWKELCVRENAKKLLIIAPASLKEKWRSDLQTYFEIKAQSTSPEDIETRLKNQEKDFALITSIQAVRYKDSKDKNSMSKAGMLNRFLEEESEKQNKLLDLVIIDEAHYLRNSDTASFRIGEKFRDISKHLLLLSATPIQTSSDNLYNLLRLLSPDDFYDKSTFAEMLENTQKIIRLATAIRRNEKKENICEFYEKAKNYITSKEILNKIDNFIKSDEESPNQRIFLFNILQKITFYNQYFTRTRKRDAFENRTDRNAKTITFDLSEKEKNIYNRISKAIKEKFSQSDIQGAFSLQIRQRQLASCLPMAVKYFKDSTNIKELIQDMIDTENLEEITSDNSELELSDDILNNTELEKNDSKYNKLRDTIKNWIKEKDDRKFIIFSFFKKTVEYISKRLNEDGVNSVFIHGGTMERNETLDRFRDDISLKVLVFSEVGSEGLDLQFCDTEVNYDLPWNPMRLEQRIGRIDRIGQKEKSINILNFVCNNTVEDKVLQRLYERIGIFTDSIGDIEPIIGKEIKNLENILMRPNEVELEERQKANLDTIANKLEMEKELEQKAGLSVAFAEEVMRNIKISEKNKRYITPESTITYIEDFFRVFYEGSRVEKYENDYCKKIILSPQARNDLRHFTKRNILNGPDHLLCNFNAKEKIKGTEIIDIKHPLIEWIKEKQKNADSKPKIYSAIEISKVKNGESGIYIYSVNEWICEGYTKADELKYFVKNLNNGNILKDVDGESFMTEVIYGGITFDKIKGEGLDNSDLNNKFTDFFEEINKDFMEFEKSYKEQSNIIISNTLDYVNKTKKRKLDENEKTLLKLKEQNPNSGLIKVYEEKKELIETDFGDREIDLNNKKCRCNFRVLAFGIIKVL